MSDPPAPPDDTTTDGSTGRDTERAVQDSDAANGEPDATHETGAAQAAENSERDLPG